MSKYIKELLEDFKTFRNSDCIYELSSQDCEVLLDYIFDLKAERIELICKNLKLNNIINELEKWLKQEADFWKEQQEKAIENGWLEFGGKYNTTIIYENAINKLQELKEGK